MVSQVTVTRQWFVFSAIVFAGMIVQAQGSSLTYSQVVEADNPTYYWNFDDTGSTTANLGSGSGGALYGRATTPRVASTTNAGGLSLGEAGAATWTNYYYGGTTMGEYGYTQYAIEYWLKLNDLTSQVYVMTAGSGGGNSSTLYSWTSSGKLQYFNGGFADMQTVSANTWYHVVIGYQPDGTVTAIMDGDYANRLTGTATANQVFGESNGYMTLGGTVGGTGYAPNADYDEVAIYNLSSLTGTQFQTKLQDLAGHYSATGGPEPSTLVLLATGLIGLLAYAWRKRK